MQGPCNVPCVSGSAIVDWQSVGRQVAEASLFVSEYSRVARG